MKITLDGEEIYIDVNNIVSVSLDKWGDDYVVRVLTTHIMGDMYRSKDKEKALKVLREVGSVLEDKKPKKTYLDGFKDGTEYALKLTKIN